MNETTQLEDVREYIFFHKKITQKEATDFLGCVRLPARIKELRDELELEDSDYVIHTEMVSGLNRKGKKISWGEYRLMTKTQYYRMMIEKWKKVADETPKTTYEHDRAVFEWGVWQNKLDDLGKKNQNHTQLDIFGSERSTETGL